MVLNLALIGLAITLDPLPLTAFIAVLPSKRGVTKGAAFVFGWLLSLAIVVTVTVLATGDNPPGADAVVEAKLSSWESYLALFGFCLRASASYLFTEIYTVFKPGQSQAPLVGFRTWIDTHTDQVIISGSLLLAHRQQPLPDPHLRHHRSPWN